MTIVTFTGKVNKQAAVGEAVTIHVTGPIEEAVVTTTGADGSFSTDFVADIAGDYTGQAHVDEDAQYLAADSNIVSFTISKEVRAITLEVTIP